ncbi:MAG TPA: AI-2E family transporter [Thermoanaerobaculia bacterium]|nr:AI-2E family transporter [Thermoanaerobaculia bacterium]
MSRIERAAEAAPAEATRSSSPWSGSEMEMFKRKVAFVFLAALLIAMLWLVRNILILIFIAAVLAAGISPVVHRVRVLGRRYLRKRIPRGAAVLIVYFPFLIAAILLIILVLPRLLQEGAEMAGNLPTLIDSKILTPLEKHFPVDAARTALSNYRVTGGGKAVILGYLRGAARVVASMLAILFLIVYMLIDAQRLRNLFLLLFPAHDRGKKRLMIIRMSRRMSGWLSGQLLLAAIIGAVTFVILVSLRIPYALPLALLAAVGEMVPVIGPIAGAIPAVIIALFKSSWQFWSVLAMAIMIQKLENLFLVPRIMGAKVSVSPLAIFIAFMMGSSLLGIIGGIMAIPAAAIIQVAFEEAFVQSRERRLDPDRAGSLLTREQ